jgi:hypothetical protein
VITLCPLKVGDVVERVDGKEGDVRDVDNLKLVLLVVMYHRGVVRLLLGRGVVGRFKGAPHKLLKYI